MSGKVNIAEVTQGVTRLLLEKLVGIKCSARLNKKNVTLINVAQDAFCEASKARIWEKLLVIRQMHIRGKFGVLCFLETPVFEIRSFALLPTKYHIFHSVTFKAGI